MNIIENAFSNFMTYCKVQKNLSQKTLKAYSIDTKQFLNFLSGYKDVNDIKDIDKEVLRAFEDELKVSECFFINRLKSQLSEQSVRFMVDKYVKLAGLDKHVTPHAFRHSFATLLLEEGVDIKYIQNFLGHSSIMTTQIYTHVNKEKQREILSQKHPRGNFLVGGRDEE